MQQEFEPTAESERLPQFTLDSSANQRAPKNGSRLGWPSLLSNRTLSYALVTGGVSIFKVAVFGNGDTSSPVWLLQQFRHRSPSLGDVEPRWTPP